jgi:uncharacterized membrane protein YqjE
MFYILGAILWVIFAFWPAIVARRKGYSFVLFFLLSLFTFIFALIAAYAVKDKTKTPRDIANDKAVDEALARDEGRA